MDKKLSYYLNNTNFKETVKHKKRPIEIRKTNDTSKNLLKIINGKICLDDNDMYVNLNINEDMEVLEDTGVVTSSTYSKKRNFVRWSKFETECFYEAISLCGTEFSLISDLFVNKDRKSCKLKYNNELKKNRMKIDQALKKRKVFTPDKYNILKEKIKKEEI